MGRPLGSKNVLAGPRGVARQAGHVHFSGITPCPRGHGYLRFTSSGRCVECAYLGQAGKSRRRDPVERARAQRAYLGQPDKKAAHQNLIRNRRARERQAEGSHTQAEIDALLEKQEGKCAGCECCIRGCYTVDHVIPLAKNGRNDISNLQLLCRSCNCRKSDMDPAVWAARKSEPKYLNGGG